MRTLYPFQKVGVAWLRENPRAGLFDEQGLGKTAQTISAWRESKLRRVLVIAPTSVAMNWEREIRRWYPELGTEVLLHGDAEIRGHGACVTTHGLLLVPELRDQLLRQSWQEIVLDEGHFFRNPTAQRTRAFFLGRDALCRRAPRCKILTGTPLPNNPLEIWPMLAGVAPERLRMGNGRLMSWHEFREHFCALASTPYGDKIVGVKNGAELRQRLDGFYIRRRKADVLDLPPVRVGTVALTGLDVSDEDELDLARDPTARARVGITLSDDVLDDVQHSGGFAAWRHASGLRKIAPAVELVDDDLRAGMKKVVLFAHHIDVIAGLANGLNVHGHQPLVLTGATPAGQRQRLVDTFQNDPAHRVFITQLQAGGVGVTLTAASDVLFVEASFTPGDNAQAMDRCHRIGQTKSVLVRFLSLAGSVDEVVAEVLARKMQMIREVIR